ncbi:hypothetical protein LX99_03458 [Mucilaginibacter oryzae]|uniref:Uncharacterized protein n=1 Tax=Mucilaginibacter oryzae TaxID=468058 RepID=A0A316H992_9SPHI|nr:hypothetical protein LX99_03458 [Mucilaginibacter oryzae]
MVRSSMVMTLFTAVKLKNIFNNWKSESGLNTFTSATLNYSKDNYFFAVQSVDADGHESLPVFPKPVK